MGVNQHARRQETPSARSRRYESRPADRRLDVLLACKSLNKLVANDAYPAEQVDALKASFRGETLVLRGDGAVRGDLADVAVRWRASVGRLLQELDR